jgi:two-component system CheB/CheR fusion protein
MAPEMLARLFEPFAQADTTLDRSKGGLGLGLTLAKGLVDLHGGTITAHSAGVGRGAEFVVRLALAPEETVSGEPVRPRTAAPGGRRRVLIIEDNIDAADSLREALQFSEHEVEVAYTGPAGIAKARACKPEVVLCDIGLPGMDGFEVARTFRADGALKGTRLVALSGYALPEDLQRAQEAGFDEHLAKPPSMESLEEILASTNSQW